MIYSMIADHLRRLSNKIEGRHRRVLGHPKFSVGDLVSHRAEYYLVDRVEDSYLEIRRIDDSLTKKINSSRVRMVDHVYY